MRSTRIVPLALLILGSAVSAVAACTGPELVLGKASSGPGGSTSATSATSTNAGAPPAVCDASGDCGLPSSCSDGIEDGQETDVDCGGTPPMGCSACADGKSCQADADCASAHCCGGTCVDLSASPTNCGICGHDCQGTVCDQGLCAYTTLAANQGTPWGIALDGASVYWTNQADGTVMKCAKAGCNGAPTQLAGGQLSPQGIATDGVNVYWTNAGTSAAAVDGTVMRCPVSGCGPSPTPFASAQAAPDGITIAGGNVYWTNNGDAGMTNGAVMTCATSGCNGQPVTLLAGAAYPSGIAADTSSIYFTTVAAGPGGGVYHAIQKCPAGGCNGHPTELVSAEEGPVYPPALHYGVALDGTDVVSVLFSMVVRCAVGGCNADQSSIAGADTDSFSIATDGTSAYFTDHDEIAAMRAVLQCPPAGCPFSDGVTLGPPPSLTMSLPVSPYGLAVDATSLYWAITGPGLVVKVAK